MNYGKVYLIGAGPGSPDLISLRGVRALRSADAVLIDRLLPRNFLEELEISTDDKQIEWLEDEYPHWSQNKINAWITRQTRQGKTVARLKGGDAFVFGQAEEETGHLAKLGIAWEAIPGPSSFNAALTEAGFPLTRRRQGRSFAVATARLAGGAVCGAFPKADSLVIMMATAVLQQVVARLMADGWPADTPTAIVERGTLAWERRVTSHLGGLAETAEKAGISSPACVIVGSAATQIFAARQRPAILFTGLDPSNYRALGNLIHWPALEVIANPQAQYALPGAFFSLKNSEFDWVVFAGKISVTSFFKEINRRKLDARLLAGMSVAAMGAGTADRLYEHGICPDIIGEKMSHTETLESFGRIDGKSVLVVEGTHGPQRLYDVLVERSATINSLSLNLVVPSRRLGRTLPEHDVIFFVSPSGVHAYWSVYGLAAFQAQAWCLGEETREEIFRHGIDADALMIGETTALNAAVSA